MDIISQDWANLIYIGCLLMMGIYNAVFYLMVKDKTYLFYAAYLLCNVVYGFFVWFRADATLKALLPPLLEYWFDYFALATTFAMAAYIAFLQSFLDLRIVLPKWDRLFQLLKQLAIPVILFTVIILGIDSVDNKWATLVLFVYVVVNLVIGLLFTIPAARMKDPKAWFFLAGLTPLIFGGIHAAIYRFQDQVNFLQLYQIGLLLEVLFFSLGLAYKQQQKEKNQQRMQFELEKSKLIQEQKQREANRLKEAEQLKNQLYSNITHEFRTPLTLILGLTDTIQDYNKERSLIKKNAHRLLKLVNEMLDLAKLDTGSLKLQEQTADIIPFLSYLTESFTLLAKEKQIRLVFYTEHPTIIMDFDPERIQQILYNLLSNILKFTDSKGKIIVHAHQKHQEGQAYLQLRIKDAGTGISKESIPPIFDRFYPTNHSDKQQAKGTGIGLALVKKLVALMKGTIEVESQPNKGTTFILQLPIKISGTEQEALTPSTLIKEEVAITSSDFTQNLAINPTSEKPVLLLIEDNLDVLYYIKTIVEKKYQVLCATDGYLGIKMAISYIPDLIISDVIMPQKNGFEVCQNLKNDERTSHIPIILLTAKAGEAAKIEGLQAGADAYLIKPFNKQELLIRLEKLQEIRQLLQNQFSGLSKVKMASLPNKEDVFLQKIEIIIEENLSNNAFGILEICQSVHLSHSQVYRKIKALTGEGVNALIRKARLQKALALLENTTLSITEIAYQTGFSDSNYFSRTFSEHFGFTPSSVRN